jgi:hypothetical protein
MDRRIFLLASLALAGCATARPLATRPVDLAPKSTLPQPAHAPVPAVTPADTALAELEPLYAADAGRDAITIQVASNGCTTKADFAFFVERRSGTVTLAFGRRRVDPCRTAAAPGRIALAFTWGELGVAPRTPVFLLNPLAAGR